MCKITARSKMKNKKHGMPRRFKYLVTESRAKANKPAEATWKSLNTRLIIFGSRCASWREGPPLPAAGWKHTKNYDSQAKTANGSMNKKWVL